MQRSTHYILVMEDLFAERSVVPGMVFDLKGKMRAQKKDASAAAAAAAAAAANLKAAAAHAQQAPAAARSGDGDGNPCALLPAGSGGGGGGEAPAEGAAALQPPPPLLPAAAAAAAAQPQPQLVLLDGDLLELTKGFPVSLTEEAKRLLDAALRRDTAWLASLAVVDYSLLIGLESGDGGRDPFRGPSGGVLTCGIIDYVRRYDIVKRLETQVKAVTALATNVEPTVVEPGRYAERLLEAADRYLAGAPTRWR